MLLHIYFLRNKVQNQRNAKDVQERMYLFVFTGQYFDHNVGNDTCGDTACNRTDEDGEHDHDKRAESFCKIREIDIFDTLDHQETDKHQSRTCSSVRDHQYQRLRRQILFCKRKPCYAAVCISADATKFFDMPPQTTGVYGAFIVCSMYGLSFLYAYSECVGHNIYCQEKTEPFSVSLIVFTYEIL